MLDLTFQDSLYVRNWEVSFFPGEEGGEGRTWPGPGPLLCFSCSDDAGTAQPLWSINIWPVLGDAKLETFLRDAVTSNYKPSVVRTCH